MELQRLWPKRLGGVRGELARLLECFCGNFDGDRVFGFVGGSYREIHRINGGVTCLKKRV